MAPFYEASSGKRLRLLADAQESHLRYARALSVTTGDGGLRFGLGITEPSGPFGLPVLETQSQAPSSAPRLLPIRNFGQQVSPLVTTALLQQASSVDDIAPVQERRLDIRDLFEASPFGLYCEECGKKVGTSPRSLRRHIAQHFNESVPLVESFSTDAEKQIRELRAEADRSEYLCPPVDGFICGCGMAFEKRAQALEHCRSKANVCSRDGIVPDLVHPTVCGRVVGESAYHPGNRFLKAVEQRQKEARKDGNNKLPVESVAGHGPGNDGGRQKSNGRSRRGLEEPKQHQRQAREAPTFPVTKFVAAKATNAFRKPILDYEKAQKSKNTANMENARRRLKLDPDTMSAAQIRELGRCRIVPPIDTGAMVLEPGSNHVIGFAATISPSLPAREPQSEQFKDSFPSEESIVNDIVFHALMVSRNHAENDRKRTSVRTSLGLAETATAKHKDFSGVPVNEHGAFFPRTHASHQHDHAFVLQTHLLSLLGKVFGFVEGVFQTESHCEEGCPCTNPLAALRRHVGPLSYPFRPELRRGANGKPVVRSADPQCSEAARAMSRISYSFAAGDGAAEEIVDSLTETYSTVERESLLRKIDRNGAAVSLHKDPRDVGKGGEAQYPEAMKRSSMEITGCDEEILQFVIVISKGLYDDSLCCVGAKSGDPVFTFRSPPKDPREGEDGLRLAVYAMDFSYRYHGNIFGGGLPENAWALRITTYVTVHASTWSNWIESRSNGDAKVLLKTIYGI